MPPYYVTNKTKKPQVMHDKEIPNDGEERIIHMMPWQAEELRKKKLTVVQQTAEQACPFL